MDEERRQEAAEIKKLPTSLLEYLPPRKWRSPKVFIPVFLLIVLFGIWFFIFMYSPSGPQSLFQQLSVTHNLNHYEKVWESQNIINYEYCLRRWTAWGEISSRIKVESGEVTYLDKNSVDCFDSEAKIGNKDLTGSFAGSNTIPRIFRTIRNTNEGRSTIKVEYHSNLGYPIFFYIDELGDDSFVGYEISDFKILEQGQTEKN